MALPPVWQPDAPQPRRLDLSGLLGWSVGGIVGGFMLLVLAAIAGFLILVFTSGGEGNDAREVRHIIGSPAAGQGIGQQVRDAEARDAER